MCFNASFKEVKNEKVKHKMKKAAAAPAPNKQEIKEKVLSHLSITSRCFSCNYYVIFSKQAENEKLKHKMEEATAAPAPSKQEIKEKGLSKKGIHVILSPHVPVDVSHFAFRCEAFDVFFLRSMFILVFRSLVLWGLSKKVMLLLYQILFSSCHVFPVVLCLDLQCEFCFLFIFQTNSCSAAVILLLSEWTSSSIPNENFHSVLVTDIFWDAFICFNFRLAFYSSLYPLSPFICCLDFSSK